MPRISCCCWALSWIFFLLASWPECVSSWSVIVTVAAPMRHSSLSRMNRITSRISRTPRYLARDDEQPHDDSDDGTAAEQRMDRVSSSSTTSNSAAAPIISTTTPTTTSTSSRQLDGLMAAVTRTSVVDTNAPTTNLPFFGEIPVDGSLVVLVPAIVIGVLGFVMSIVVAYNNKDTFVDQLTAMSQEINTAALAKTNSAQGGGVEGSCRGLCSSQNEQLENMRTFMNGLARSSE